jgi:hypothetical protein
MTCSFENSLRAIGKRIDQATFGLARAPFFERIVYALEHRFERDSGILPAFNQRPVERRQEEETGSTSALEMFFNLGEVVEVISMPLGFFTHALFLSEASLRADPTCREPLRPTGIVANQQKTVFIETASGTDRSTFFDDHATIHGVA